MSDREKLIALMEEAYYCSIEELADHLLAHGVVVREKGEWTKRWCDNNLIGHEYAECPFCGCTMLDTNQFWDANFCPNCGADMRKGENG